MLLAALHEMYVRDGIGAATKQETIRFISNKHWFDFHDEDRNPYPSRANVAGEPRWHTLIAWARQDGVIRDYVSYEARDAWGLTRLGRDTFERFKNRFVTGERPVAPCFLWSIQFKRHMNPNYEPSPSDKKRPCFFYRDTGLDLLADFV